MCLITQGHNLLGTFSLVFVDLVRWICISAFFLTLPTARARKLPPLFFTYLLLYFVPRLVAHPRRGPRSPDPLRYLRPPSLSTGYLLLGFTHLPGPSAQWAEVLRWFPRDVRDRRGSLLHSSAEMSPFVLSRSPLYSSRCRCFFYLTLCFLSTAVACLDRASRRFFFFFSFPRVFVILTCFSIHILGTPEPSASGTSPTLAIF